MNAGLPILYTSQSLGKMPELTGRLITLEQGKILYNGSMHELAKYHGMLHYLVIIMIDNILLVTE